MPEYLTASQRRRVESYRRIGTDVFVGSVEIDPESCCGCALCSATCPSGVLEVVDKKSRMATGTPLCFSCGCCAAICPKGAIEMTDFLEFNCAFHYLDRGEPELPRRF